jgi:hypothetical protein
VIGFGIKKLLTVIFLLFQIRNFSRYLETIMKSVAQLAIEGAALLSQPKELQDILEQIDIIFDIAGTSLVGSSLL